MNLYPAIDLKDGQCVRLYKGQFDQMTVYDNNPTGRARSFAAMGFSWLHMVDLDGALAGKGVNTKSVMEVRAAIDIKIQIGGGIRNMDAIENWLAAGVTRVILGTIAVKDSEFVKLAAKRFPNQIAVGIDSIGGMVATHGWGTTSDLGATELAKRFEGAGVCAIIATDIARDGTKTGVNVKLTQDLANAVNIPIIASGGLASVDDIIALKNGTGTKIEGAILGKALYDGLIDADFALRAAK